MSHDMPTCSCCGEPYVLQSQAWGSRCGACIAAQLELMLIGDSPATARRPMMRATAEDSDQLWSRPEERKAVNR